MSHGPEISRLLAADRKLAQMREQVAPRRIVRTPWGWDCYTPGREDDIQAPDLDQLAARLAQADTT